MKKGKNQIIHYLEVIFWLMAFGVLLFFLLGELILPAENSGNSSGCQPFLAQWNQILPDGSKKPVEVPGHCQAEKGEQVVLETFLPTDIIDNSRLCFRSSQQDMQIFIDGKLRQEYTTKDSRPFGKNSMSAYVFVELSVRDAGKALRVVTVSDSSYSGVLNPVYYGDSMGIWKYFISQNSFQTIIIVLMLIFSVICIVFCIGLRLGYKRLVSQEYLGWGIFLVAVWMLFESRLRQLFFSNVSIVGNMTFLVVMLIPIPFLLYVNSIQKQRYQKYYVAEIILAVVNFGVCNVLQLLNWKDFLETMVMSHILLVLAVILIIYTIIQDIRKGYIMDYFLVVAGLWCVILSGGIEVILVYIKQTVHSGNALAVGLHILLLMATFNTVRNIMRTERENQRAIALGESKAGFLANMSHEIRTPINTILGMNEMILRENQEKNIRGYALNVQRSGNMLLSLISDILEFSQISAGEFELEETPYHLSSLLNDVIHMLKNRVEQKNLQVRLKIDETLPAELLGDEVRIKQILTHLITNAVKYTNEGYIALSVQGIESEHEDFILNISVEDTGKGIRKEDIGKLFETFIRIDEKRNRAIEGVGLGLNITRQILTKMNGDIHVQSIYGEGSLFTVQIPQKVLNRQPIGNLTEAYEKESKAYEQYQESFQAPQANVLVVDDNRMNLAVAKGLLKKTMVHLETASSGAEALRFMKQKKYDIILMDHMMPEPNGIETLHLLRADKTNPNLETPVIALTANAIAGSREMYLKEGFQDYIPKPIPVEKLEEILRKWLPAELIIVQERPVEEEKKKSDNEKYVPSMDSAVAQEPVTEQSDELIDRKIGMSYCADEEELYQEILQTYYAQGQLYREKLSNLYQQKDWKELVVIVHAIKSTSMNIGAAAFSEKAKKMEQYLKDGLTESFEAGWDSFWNEYEQVLSKVTEIAEIKESSSAPEDQDVSEKKKVSGQEYRQECEILLEHVIGYEMNEAMEQIERMLKIMTVPEEAEVQTEMLSQIKSDVDGFDYDHAEEVLRNWILQQQEK